MTLKTASMLALIGMALLTVLVVTDFVTIFSGVLSDAIAPAKLLSSFIYLLASATLTLFLFVFHKSQA